MSPPPIAGLTTFASVQASAGQIVDSRMRTMAQHHGLVAQALSPADVAGEGNRVGLFASVGSQSLGGSARVEPLHGFVLAGAIFESQANYDGGQFGYARLRPSTTFGGSLRYLVPRGTVRPFVEAGGWIAPKAELEFRRGYMNGSGTATGVSNFDTQLSYYYGRVGAVVRLGSLAQLSAAGELGREHLTTNAFVEQLSNANPFEAHFAQATDRVTLAKGTLALSRDLGNRISFTMSAGYVRAFDGRSGTAITVPGIGTLSFGNVADAQWVEYSGSVSYRFMKQISISLFATGVAGDGRRIGSETHAGIALRAGF